MKRELHILYHDKCMDGLLGAGILHDLLGADGLHPLTYPAQPDVLKFNDVDVIIVDYVVKSDVLLTLISRGCRVFCLDHHIASLPHYEEVYTNIPNRQDLSKFFVIFNVETSGAALAELFALKIKDILDGDRHATRYKSDDTYIFNFNTFAVQEILDVFNKASLEAEPDSLICYLSNADTYKYPQTLEQARHIRIGLEHAHEVEPEQSFITYLHLYRRYLNDWSELERVGRDIEAERIVEYDTIIDAGTRFEIGYQDETQSQSGTFIVCYAPHAIANSVSQRIYKRYPDTYFAVVGRVSETDETLLELSFRGQNGVNPFDLSQLAGVFNGGGHFHAAGGRLTDYTDEKFRSVIEWETAFDSSQLPYAGILTITD